MASPHVSLKSGKAGNGAAHASYLEGEGKYADRDDVAAVEDGNLPNWAADAGQFFAAADANERKNGRAYLEVEAAIPREAPDPVAWARDFAKEIVGDRFAYRLAVHDRAASDGGRNVHLHLMFSDRPTDGGHFDSKQFFKRNGSKKDRTWNGRDQVRTVREVFASHVSQVAPDWSPAKSENPEPKIGPALPRAGWRYEETRQARLSQVEEIRAQRRIEQAAELGRAERAEAEPGLIDLSTDLRSALAERDTQEQTYEQRQAEFLNIDPGLLAARRGPASAGNGLRRLSECHLARAESHAARQRDPADARLLQADARDHRRGSDGVHDARLVEQERKEGRTVVALTKLAMYAGYAEQRADSPAGQAFRQHLQEMQRHWPKSLQAIEGEGFKDRALLEFAAEDMLRDGLITEDELAASGIQVDPDLVDKDDGKGRAQDAMQDFNKALVAAEADRFRSEVLAVKSAIAAGMVDAKKNGTFDSSVVQNAIASAKSAVQAPAGPTMGGGQSQGQSSQPAPSQGPSSGSASAPKPPSPKP
jgi:hypothetical protein